MSYVETSAMEEIPMPKIGGEIIRRETDEMS